MKQLVYLAAIAVYATIALAIVSPCLGTWGIDVCVTIALLVGFSWGLLNEIRAQLMILIGLIKEKKQKEEKE